MDNIIYGLDNILAEIFDLLPNSPFVGFFELSADADILYILQWVNLFVPVGEILQVMGLWLICIASYYVVSVVLRMIKAVQ